jgi:hypothetical protein
MEDDGKKLLNLAECYLRWAKRQTDDNSFQDLDIKFPQEDYATWRKTSFSELLTRNGLSQSAYFDFAFKIMQQESPKQILNVKKLLHLFDLDFQLNRELRLCTLQPSSKSHSVPKPTPMPIKTEAITDIQEQSKDSKPKKIGKKRKTKDGTKEDGKAASILVELRDLPKKPREKSQKAASTPKARAKPKKEKPIGPKSSNRDERKKGEQKLIVKEPSEDERIYGILAVEGGQYHLGLLHENEGTDLIFDYQHLRGRKFCPWWQNAKRKLIWHSVIEDPSLLAAKGKLKDGVLPDEMIEEFWNNADVRESYDNEDERFQRLRPLLTSKQIKQYEEKWFKGPENSVPLSKNDGTCPA